MAKISIIIPDELHDEIKASNLDVSKIVEHSIKEEIIKLIALKTIASKSSLTEKDALELGKLLKKGRVQLS